jgi:hypothetical protein
LLLQVLLDLALEVLVLGHEVTLPLEAVACRPLQVLLLEWRPHDFQELHRYLFGLLVEPVSNRGNSFARYLSNLLLCGGRLYSALGFQESVERIYDNEFAKDYEQVVQLVGAIDHVDGRDLQL